MASQKVNASSKPQNFLIFHFTAVGMAADSPVWPEPMVSRRPAATNGSSTDTVAKHGSDHTGYERTARPAAQMIGIKKTSDPFPTRRR